VFVITTVVMLRFEKRIYIPLPETHARKSMLTIHLGDTPNALTDENFQTIAEKTEGCAEAISVWCSWSGSSRLTPDAVNSFAWYRCSGSDISVLVREALMEPLRMCQQARFFTRVRL
jgi:vacuolar protein-sorting-associated protein 4